MMKPLPQLRIIPICPVELTPQIVYGVLASEIAAQRGAAGSSAATDLAAAARDPRLAQRAAEFALFSGQLKDAADALALWMELDPSSQIPANSCSSPCCVPASWQKASRW
jgi:outer membrane protein TolC